MTADHLYFNWWREDVDGEDRIFVRHICLDDVPDDYMLPIDGRWRDGNGPQPSFDCGRCGRHTVLNETDRIDPPPSAKGASE